jgi:hypothetical protein
MSDKRISSKYLKRVVKFKYLGTTFTMWGVVFMAVF